MYQYSVQKSVLDLYQYLVQKSALDLYQYLVQKSVLDLYQYLVQKSVDVKAYIKMGSKQFDFDIISFTSFHCHIPYTFNVNLI